MKFEEHNIKAAEDFIRSVLKDNFGQFIENVALQEAALKLCRAIPNMRTSDHGR